MKDFKTTISVITILIISTGVLGFLIILIMDSNMSTMEGILILIFTPIMATIVAFSAACLLPNRINDENEYWKKRKEQIIKDNPGDLDAAARQLYYEYRNWINRNLNR